jgi:hypothetical protein
MLSYFRQGIPDCPCDPADFPLQFHEVLAQYVDAIRPYVIRNFDKSLTNELFGKNSCFNYKLTSDLVLLAGFLSLVYAEKHNKDETLDCPKTTASEMYTKYNLACLKPYFKCFNIDAEKFIKIFGLTPNDSPDGINFMEIEGDEACYNPFKVR